MIPVVIVGAGIAGLACARRLVQAGVRPILFDKGRESGGRVATRRAYEHMGKAYAASAVALAAAQLTFLDPDNEDLG